MADNGTILSELYYNPELPSSFGGVDPLAKAAKEKGINKKQFLEWLETQRTYTLHKPVRYHFPRNRVLVYGLDEEWQADLIEFANLARFNQDFRFILVSIDILSKFAWGVPLKNKTQEEVIRGFKVMFDSGRHPMKLQTDAGGEFGPNVQKFLHDKGIKHFVSRNEDIKCSVIERFIKTIKLRLFRYFTQQGKQVYVDVLPKFVKSYNQSFHRSIGMRPVDVTSDEANRAHSNLYKDTIVAAAPSSNFKIGDKVRLAIRKHAFSRSFHQLWTEEIFTITKIIKRTPYPVYTVSESDGTEITGTFYPRELQKVNPPQDIYTVEKVLKIRQRRGRPKEYFVQWRGSPAFYKNLAKALLNINHRFCYFLLKSLIWVFCVSQQYLKYHFR